MSKRRYGSKAAYEADRRPYKMTDEERAAEDAKQLRERNADRLRDDAMMTHMLFMAAAMAGGENTERADKQAEAAVAKLRARFT